MRKTTIIWLITAASFVLVGCILFAGVMTTLKWDFTKLSTVSYETNTYEISEEFDAIAMNTDTADIVFVLSDDGKCTVECYEEENAKYFVAVQEGTLDIQVSDHKPWYDHIGINIRSPKITVYLPKTEYTSLFIHEDTGDVVIPKDFAFENVDIAASTGDIDFFASASELIRIKTSTGDICTEKLSAAFLDLSVTTGQVTVSGVTCDEVTISVSTGKTYLTDIVCKSVISTGNTGDISLNRVIAAEKFSIHRSTGDIKFDASDAAEIFVETDTGDVTGSLLTDKLFIAQTDTGSVDVPETVTGGKCEITTNTGDIKLDIP